MLACIAVAISGHAHVFPGPWSEILGIFGTIGTAITGYLIKSKD